MKITCSDYAGFDAAVTELGSPANILYDGDSSSEYTMYIVAIYDIAPYAVVVFENQSGVLITTVTTDYATAVRVAGLENVEV